MLALALVAAACALAAGETGPGYPRIANLWGYYPNAKPADYDRLARYDMLVMAGGSPTAFRTFRAAMKKRNPHQLLLGTAPLMNLGAPDATPWMKKAWYLHRADGSLVSWWAGQVYAPNLFLDGCLDALLGQTDKAYGELLRDGVIDGVFYDSVVGAVTWYGDVDTNGDGKPDAAAVVNPRWQARQNLFFDRLRERWPGVLILANDVDEGHRPHLNGRLFEGAPLLDRVADGSLTPQDAIAALNAWTAGSRKPPITFAIMTHPLGWQGWRVGRGSQVTTPGEVDRVRRCFHRMRLGLLTCLMTDAYYSYDFGTVWYGLPWWYAEYDAPLGQARGPAREVFDVPPVTILDWRAGQPAGDFVLDGDSKATPEGLQGAQPDSSAAWTRLFATDPAKLHFEPGKTYRIEADCLVLRKPTGTFQFDARTATGGWERHDKGITHYSGPGGSDWRITATVMPDDFQDYALEWHVQGAGALSLRSLKVMMIHQSYLRRDFDGGAALLNTSARPVTVKLGETMRRLKGSAAPLHVVEVDDASPDFSAKGLWQRAAGDDHYYGAGYRSAAKPGSTARWAFTAPSADTYSFFACFPGGKSSTDAAAYALRGAGPTAAATVTQRTGDGGWVRLFEAKLAAGGRYEVVLTSGGAGTTAADAIRIESAARYNDGATVTSVTLPPLDGMVLLRR